MEERNARALLGVTPKKRGVAGVQPKGGTVALQGMLEQRRQVADIYCLLARIRDEKKEQHIGKHTSKLSLWLMADFDRLPVNAFAMSVADAAPALRPHTAGSGVGTDEWLTRFKNGENLIRKGVDSDETFASGRSAKQVMERFASLFSAGGDEAADVLGVVEV